LPIKRSAAVRTLSDERRDSVGREPLTLSSQLIPRNPQDIPLLHDLGDHLDHWKKKIQKEN